MTKRYSVAAEWAESERKTLSGASAVQRDEMRTAFWCGALAEIAGRAAQRRGRVH
jgi:hypothetical protein